MNTSLHDSHVSHSSTSKYGQALLTWRAPEHEPLDLGPRSRVIATILLILIIAYALFTNSPLMAITFILIGVLGYLSMHRESQIREYAVTSLGIIAGPQFYPYEEVVSFWLYDEPAMEGLLSIRTQGTLLRYIHIPILTVERNELAETLRHFIPEEKHEPTLVDTLERLLHI